MKLIARLDMNLNPVLDMQHLFTIHEMHAIGNVTIATHGMVTNCDYIETLMTLLMLLSLVLTYFHKL